VQNRAQEARLDLAVLAPGAVGAMRQLDQDRLEISEVVAAEQNEAVGRLDGIGLQREAHR
jgi:hypothetical protein